MRSWVYGFWFTLAMIPLASSAQTGAGDGNPIKYISSCEMDFNGDGERDIALLIESSHGRQLIVMIKTNRGYDSFVVSQDKPEMHLSCHFGATLKESEALGTSKVFQTPGTYIQLRQPEGGCVAYFWNGCGFTEVWTGD